MVTVTFWGVRGSVPTPGGRTSRYGGNSSCVVVAGAGADPLVLDMGTGFAAWGRTIEGPARVHALVSHLHWDHIEGISHFRPLDASGTVLDVYGPTPELIKAVARPPYFPVSLGDRAGTTRFIDVDHEELTIGSARVLARSVPHRGPTNGYRLDVGGVRIAYVSDHQAPPSGDRVSDSVLELADDADLLIHDAQYTAAEFAARPGWGHSTVDYAVVVAREAGVKRLALFHHDPGRSDDELDTVVEGARRLADRLGVGEVLAATEGVTLELGG